jgi:hypothetical protein
MEKYPKMQISFEKFKYKLPRIQKYITNSKYWKNNNKNGEKMELGSSTLNTCSALLLEFWLVDGYVLCNFSKKLVHTSYNSVVPSEADLVWRIALEIID